LNETTLYPLVTVITPSFNQGRFIEETILSVLTQDYTNIEYLVIDGASSDNTLDVLRKYEHRLHWISEADRGQSHAINKGLRMARGDIVCWLNSDDTFELGAIGRVVNHFCLHSEVMMVSGGVNLIDENSHVLETLSVSIPFDLWSVVYFTQNIPQPATFFRKSVLNYIGFLNEDLHWCMDWDLWVRIGSVFKVDCVNDILANTRMYMDTKTGSGGFKRWFEIVSAQKKYTNSSFPNGLLRTGFGAVHMWLKFNYPVIYSHLRKYVDFLKSRILNDYYKNFHGVYDDKWLGKKARFILGKKPGCNFAAFVINLPNDKRLFPNKLHVKSCGYKATIVDMPSSGTYEIQIPCDGALGQTIEIELRFAKSLPLDAHRRRLACKLQEIYFVA